MDQQFREINCQKANTGVNFGQGVQDYNFNVGGATLWHPSKSYFKIKMRVSGAANQQPEIQEQLALADSVVGNLFDNVYFRGGGQDISSIVSFAPQASALRQRLTKSGAWLNSMGKDVYGLDASYTNRVNAISFITDPIAEDQYERINLGSSEHRLDYTCSVNLGQGGTVFLNGVNTNFDGTPNGNNTPDVPVNAANGQPAVPLLRAGDIIRIAGKEYTVLVVATDTQAQLVPLGTATDEAGNPFPLDVNIAAQTGVYAYRAKTGTQRATVCALWKPPIGIFDSDKPMGSGDFRVSLNPNARYKTSAIESIAKQTPSDNPANVGEFNFEVLELKLYICLTTDTVRQSGVEQLFLSEQMLQSKPITTVGENTMDFTVPPSTKMLAFFIQSGKAGSDTRVPPSRFKALEDYDMGLKSFQLTYANRSRPSTRWASVYDTTENCIQQRFWDTYSECGLANLQGGTETLADFIQRGCVFVYRFDRDSTDKATQVQLQVNMSEYEPGSNVILCAFYTRTVEVAYQNGMITDVRSLNV